MITAIILGAGDRGTVYASYALSHPDKLKIVGVAEPNPERREQFTAKFQVPHVFSTWEHVFNKDKFADAVIITTPDQLHYAPTLKALEKGYHILLEKPIAPKEEQVKTILKQAKEKQVIVQIAHVLRYTKFYSKVKELLSSGRLGEIINITMMENVSYYHYAHSYIRGNWHNRETSSPMILAKCSHDLDLMYWFVENKPELVSSFGELSFFKNKSKDFLAQLPERCTDGCLISNSCLYYAPRIYIDLIPFLHLIKNTGGMMEKITATLVLKYPWIKKLPFFSKINSYDGWPVSVITNDFTIEGKMKALREGDYGKCVYKVSDHNVVDHQVVIVQFKNQITASLTMHGHSSEEGRFIRIDGSKGTLIGEFKLGLQHLVFIESLTNKKQIVLHEKNLDGHGGGDWGMLSNFIKNVEAFKRGEKPRILTSLEESFISHEMAFAADKSRLTGKIVSLNHFS